MTPEGPTVTDTDHQDDDDGTAEPGPWNAADTDDADDDPGTLGE